MFKLTLFTNITYAQLVIEGIRDSDEKARIVGSFTMPSGERRSGAGRALGPQAGIKLFYDKAVSGSFTTVLMFNSADIRFLNRRDLSSTTVEFDTATTVVSNDSAPSLFVTGSLPRGDLDSSSIDTVAVQFYSDGGGAVTVGRVDGNDVLGSNITVNHEIVLSSSMKAQLQALTGQTLMKLEIGDGELELKVEDISIGEVTRVFVRPGETANPVITRADGSTLVAEVGTKLFEGDIIETDAFILSMGIELRGGDGYAQVMSNLGPNTKVEIQRSAKKKVNIFNMFTGWIRSEVLNLFPQREPNYKLIKRHRGCACGIRGTIVTMEVIDDSSETTVVTTVDEGLVDFINRESGEIIEVAEGETHTIVQPIDHPNGVEDSRLVAINNLASADLTEGDRDWFKFEVLTQGVITIESTGDTDTYATVWNAPEPTGGNIVDEDDDGDGSDLNFRISREFTPGTYYLEVKGYDTLETGGYRLIINQEGSFGSAAFSAGFIGREMFPESDPFNRGVSNGVAYALGLPLDGELDSSSFALLPQSASSLYGKVAAMEFFIPELPPADVEYKIVASTNLGTDPQGWVEIAQKSGPGSWVGSQAHQITEGDVSNSQVPVVVEYPDILGDKGFMRLEVVIDE